MYSINGVPFLTHKDINFSFSGCFHEGFFTLQVSLNHFLKAIYTFFLWLVLPIKESVSIKMAFKHILDLQGPRARFVRRGWSDRYLAHFRNCANTTIVICEQKTYPVSLSCSSLWANSPGAPGELACRLSCRCKNCLQPKLDSGNVSLGRGRGSTRGKTSRGKVGNQVHIVGEYCHVCTLPTYDN